jgi:DNA-binding transcriptional LysR family regulator
MRSNLGLRQLEAIMAIATHGSFSAAAGQLHVSQPALSRTVRLAEEGLGARLFDRGSRKATLTAAGAELLPIARRIMLEFRDSIGELSQFVEGKRGRVRVSALPSIAQSLLVDAIAGFNAAYPAIEFLVRSDSAETVLALLESREIDIGLTVQPPPDGRFAYEHLHDDEFVLVCRADDPLARQARPAGALAWSALETRPFIAATSGSNTRGATDAAFMRARLNVHPAHEVASSNLQVIGGLVAAGLGLSVLPASALACLGQTSLVARRLTKPRMQRKVGIVTLTGRTLSPATDRFCEHIRSLGRASSPWLEAATPVAGSRSTSRPGRRARGAQRP